MDQWIRGIFVTYRCNRLWKRLEMWDKHINKDTEEQNCAITNIGTNITSDPRFSASDERGS